MRLTRSASASPSAALYLAQLGADIIRVDQIGGAFTQLCACDFAIVADEATFGLSEVNWGIIPGGLVSWNLTDMLLPRHAMYYAATGESFDGKRAVELGLCVEAHTDAAKAAAGADIILANTYHLFLRPGHELIRSLRHEGITIVAVEHVMKAILAVSHPKNRSAARPAKPPQAASREYSAPAARACLSRRASVIAALASNISTRLRAASRTRIARPQMSV